MADTLFAVRRADLRDPADLRDYLAMLGAYARDSMGAGGPLATDVTERLACELPTHPTLHALLAVHAGGAVGFATCFVGYSTFRARPLLNIHDIAVLTEWRGRGIGTALLETTENLARSLGCCAVTLEVRSDNPGAQTLYRRHGVAPATCSQFMEKAL